MMLKEIFQSLALNVSEYCNLKHISDLPERDIETYYEVGEIQCSESSENGDGILYLFQGEGFPDFTSFRTKFWDILRYDIKKAIDMENICEPNSKTRDLRVEKRLVTIMENDSTITISHPLLLMGYMLLDAINCAMDECSISSNDEKNLSPKQRLNSLSESLYKTDSTVVYAKDLRVPVQTHGDALKKLGTEIHGVFCSNKKPSLKVRNLIAYIKKIVEIPLYHYINGLDYKSLENNIENQIYRCCNSVFFKDMYFIHVVNDSFTFIDCLCKGDFDSSKYTFTSIYLKENVTSNNLHYVGHIINRWSVAFKECFFRNNVTLNDSIFWESLSINFPVCITPIFWELTNISIYLFLKLNFFYYKKGVKSFEELKLEYESASEENDEVDFLEILSRTQSIKNSDLIDNPFNKDIVLAEDEIRDKNKDSGIDKILYHKSDRKFSNFGCPFHIFSLSIAKLEDLLNQLILISSQANEENIDHFYALACEQFRDSKNVCKDERVEILKEMLINSSFGEYPILEGLFKSIPCYYEYKSLYKGSNKYVKYKLRISPIAKDQSGNLTKLRKLQSSEWDQIIETYCVGNMDYARNDIRSEFNAYQGSERNTIKKCKRRIKEKIRELILDSEKEGLNNIK